jgi:hypothetical protein
MTTTPATTATPAEPKSKRKNPRYDVYRVDIEGLLKPVATDVAASSRREAIKAQDDPYGTFAVCRAGELVVLTRNKKVVEEDDWT